MPLFKRNDIFAGRYVLNEFIGKGCFSEVWKARDQMAENAVIALKICIPEKESRNERIRQFKRQFSLSQQISHPHLLKVSYFDVWEGLPYLVMPYCPSGSVVKLVESKGPLTEKQVALLLCQIGSALEALHTQEPPVLHRNIKPSTILSVRDDYFLLADFGRNNENTDTLSNSAPASKEGASAYAPPEYFDQNQQTGTPGDIFSLGISLYEMSTTTLPLAGSGGLALLKGRSIPSLPNHFSADLNELLQACMSANKNRRPTAGELHLRGKQYLEKGNWNLPEKGEEKRKSGKLLTYLIAATFALLLLGIYWGMENNYLPTFTEGGQSEASSGSKDQEQDINEMLIATLEDQLKDMTNRALELEEENQQLKQNGSEGIIRREVPEVSVKENQVQNTQERKREVKNEPRGNVVSTTYTAPKRRNHPSLTSEIEQHLNKISDPAISGQDRKAWKKQTMDQFAEGTVQIMDVSDGTPKRYSTRIFVNLLYKVPHTVVVKEVKRDENKKVTELRLEMQPKG